MTLRDRKGKLRGCIGQLKPVDPLYKAVQKMVIAHATKDARFPPVRPDEIKDLTIEISALTPPKTVHSLKEFKLGKEGVIISKGKKRGVFLPEVEKIFQAKKIS